MEFPDMDKLLDELEESAEDFVKSSSTHILDEKTFSKGFQPIDLVQKVENLEESIQLNEVLSNPNDSLPEKLSLETVPQDGNEEIKESSCESPPLVTQEDSAVNKAQECNSPVQLTVEKVPEDQPPALQEVQENSLLGILENVVKAISDESILEEIVGSHTITNPPTDNLTLLAIADQSKDVSVELDAASNPPTAQPIALSEQEENQAAHEISVVPKVEIKGTDPTAVNLLPGALLADINGVDREDALSQDRESKLACELPKQDLEAQTIGADEKKTGEMQPEQETKHSEIEKETASSGLINSQEGGTCNQVETVEKIEMDSQPDEERTVFNDESTVEEKNHAKTPEEMVSRDDLYEEIERMEKLILAEKQALLLSGDAPSTPPIICFGKDATILTSSTVNKSSLTTEEKNFLTPTSQKLLAEPDNSSVTEIQKKRDEEAVVNHSLTEERLISESKNNEISTCLHFAKDGGYMNELIETGDCSSIVTESMLTTKEISFSDPASQEPTTESATNKIMQTRHMTQFDSKDSLTEEHTVAKPENAQTSPQAVYENDAPQLEGLTAFSRDQVDDESQTAEVLNRTEAVQPDNVQTSSPRDHKNDSDDLEISPVSPETSYQQLGEASDQCIQGIEDTECELARMVDEEVVSEVTENEEISNFPSTSSATNSSAQGQIKLTESELQLAKVKPYWIPDEECSNCMLCSAKFTIVNRRHHCRSCGRVLCSGCCTHRRMLPYMEGTDRKQRVCTPCNTTLDMIEEYEKNIAATNTIQQNNNDAAATQQNSLDSSNIFQSENIFASTDNQPCSSSLNESKKVINTRKKSVLKVRRPHVVDPTEADTASPVLSNHLAGDVPTPTCTTSATPTSIVLSTPTIAPATSTSLLAQPKRSVTFRDGVNPGDSPTAGEGGREGGCARRWSVEKESKKDLEKNNGKKS